MKSPTHLEFSEPERYELAAPPSYVFPLNRREFVQTLGAGILISMAVPSVFGQRRGGPSEASLDDRLHIGEDGTITVFTSKVEVGQGSRTELTMAAAEELGVPVSQVRLVMADTSVGPNDGGTAGSRTTPDAVPAVRRGCAAAREILLEAAAKKFGAEAATLRVREGSVEPLGSNQHFGYADLGKEGAALTGKVPSGVELRAVNEWKVLGTPVSKVSGREVVTGQHQYPSDIVRPGMLYGRVLRPSAYKAELIKIDLEAGKRAGAVAVRDGNFVGVAAKNSFAAEQARRQLAKTAEWKDNPHTSSDELYEHLEKTAQKGRRQTKGAPDSRESGGRNFSQTYNIAYIQHAPMEPRAAVAEWTEGKLTVWTGSQMPSRVREELARAFQISQERVRVVVPDTGGGFGGKHSGECAVEAARLAKETGKPVHLRWTREEEFTWAYFRPAGVIQIKAGLKDGKITQWEHVNINSGGSAIETPYEIPNTATEFRGADGPLRSGSYRGLAATANTFARESMMDEIAAAAGMNPLEFRLRHITNERLGNVLLAVTEKFGWKDRCANHEKSVGCGLACGTEKGSYVATCVQLRMSIDGRFKVEEVCEAFECGPIQNPRNLKAQVEGAIMQGLGGALREEIRFKDGKMLNARFSQYAVPRFKDLPKIETVLLNRKDLPAVGAGETPIIGIAPAIANAVYHASQVRIRTMPIQNDAIRSA